MKHVGVYVNYMQLFVIINKVGIMLNANANAKN